MSGMFEVLSFVRARKGGLRPEEPVVTGDASSAARMAQRLSKSRDIVIAIARDSAGERTIMLSFGDIPECVLDALG